MDQVLDEANVVVRFCFATITSHFIGEYLASTRFRVPHLTGYLLGGFISGPAGINLVTSRSLHQLGFLNGVALAAIAFSAGTELYFPDIKPHLKMIVSHMAMISLTTLIGCAGIVMAIRPWVPYITSVAPACQFQMALICGSIMIARSPSSALALIQSLFAKGELTSLCMGITVVSDAVLLVIFATVSSLATAECTGSEGIDTWAFIALVISVFGSIFTGWIISKIIVGVIWLPILPSRGKGIVILAAGTGVFVGSKLLERMSGTVIHHVFRVEPLLVCIAASCFACHATSKRLMLSMILKKTSILAFLPFFTLTGASFNVLSIWPILPLSIALFTSRMVAIWLGSWMALSCSDQREQKKRMTFLWMTLTTQAGAAIGLANEVSQSFSPWGPSFADAVTVVVVLNQIFGPFIFRWALRRVGEDRSPKTWRDRDVAVLGVNRTAMSISSRLCLSGCRVRFIRPDFATADLAQKQIQKVKDYLRSMNIGEVHLTLVPDALPSNSDRFAFRPKTLQNPVDLDYCPPSDPLNDDGDLEAPLLTSRTGESTTLEALVSRLIPAECATVIVSFDDDDLTLRACEMITTLCCHVIPRIVAIVQTEPAVRILSRLGIIVVHAHAALADVTTALALTHSSEGVSIVMPGRFSVRSVKNMIRPIDYPDGITPPVISPKDPIARIPSGIWSIDDLAVPMMPRPPSSSSLFPPLSNDWTWFRQEMIRRRQELKRISEDRPTKPRWMSLG